MKLLSKTSRELRPREIPLSPRKTDIGFEDDT